MAGTTKKQGKASWLRRLSDRGLWLSLFVPGVLVTAALSFAHWSQPGWLQFLDYKAYDILLAHRPHPQPSGQVAVVDIDEKSLAEVGQWPWPRYRMALLLGRLKQYGVLAVGMDMVFSEPDQTSPGRIQRELRELGVDVGFTGLPESLADNDALLANTLAQGPYVLGYFFTFQAADASARNGGCLLAPPRVAVRKAAGAANAPVLVAQATAAACPLPELVQAGGWTGFFNSVPDRDNIVRWIPQAIGWRGQVYPGLAMATLMRAFGDRGAVLDVAPNPYGGQDISFSLSLGPLGKREVPLDRHGRMLLDYRGPARTFPYLPAADVMRGTADPKALEGKIVFIGTSARGLEDIRATPLDQGYPGVEAHATAADMILSGTYLRRPVDAWYIEQVLLVFFGLGITLQLMFARSLWAAASSLFAGAGVCLAGSLAMNRLSIHLSPVTPLITLGVIFTLVTFVKFLREERQRRFIQTAFSHYLPPAVVERIVEEPSSLNLDGEERDVSIFFSDVRGFTGISEHLSPTQVVALLHEYLTPMTRLVTANMGTLDKFIGDAIMAFWNAPLDVADHPRRAVETSLAMLRELDGLNAGFMERFGFEIQIGIGLHRGMARVGNFGSKDLFDYTLIGDNVNLCSRLEGLTKYYRVRLLASQAMREGAGEGFAWQEADRVRVKGKSGPVTIFTILENAREGELERWEQALALYRARGFAAARGVFEALHAETGRGLYEEYAARCGALEKDPPGPDWDGVFGHTAK